jgi:hypothetical protein
MREHRSPNPRGGVLKNKVALLSVTAIVTLLAGRRRPCNRLGVLSGRGVYRNGPVAAGGA